MKKATEVDSTMSLKLTNSLTNKKEFFIPLFPKKVSIYCCGVTVYDLCHLGHARSYINWDVLRRFLIWEGYKVTFVQNFTDIDDKILNKAKEEDCSMQEVSERNIADFYIDMKMIGIMPPDRMPRATKCINEIRSLIGELERKGAAYSSDGDVYFSVMKHKDYGKLSGRNLYEQQKNADGRITRNEESRKRHQFDFALWKKAKNGEPSFPSKWGEGRPGWHIECSAMVRKELGETIDIHLGGSDLIFPHHENEIAQSEVANEKELARYWLHNGMVNVEGQKMSKSLGNFKTIREILEKGFSAMSLRLFVLQAHYRKPLDFTDEALKAASNGWNKLNNALSLKINNEELINEFEAIKTNEVEEKYIHEELSARELSFKKAMNEDLNTSEALSIIFELAQPLNALSNKIKRKDIQLIKPIKKREILLRWKQIIELSKVLGLIPEKEMEQISLAKNELSEREIQLAIEERKLAKIKKDFQKADKIRDELKTKGIELIDKENGLTNWILK